MSLSNHLMSKYRKPMQCQTVQRNMKKPTKFKMNRISINFLMTIAILALLPYSSTLSLPNGDPAPGRSPGPPEVEDKEVSTDDKVIEVGEVYDETTTSEEVEVTTVSEVVSERTVDISDACAFARIPSDSDDIVTLSEDDSDVNLTLSHPVFETDELVRGVVYDAD
uniref:SFRICE_009783 n=1 Tax=Spodoptera frugiperda TaxID=7108 RepID=A0A2H1VCY5_SPOFR